MFSHVQHVFQVQDQPVKDVLIPIGIYIMNSVHANHKVSI